MEPAAAARTEMEAHVNKQTSYPISSLQIPVPLRARKGHALLPGVDSSITKWAA
jgi:hypothetical protein